MPLYEGEPLGRIITATHEQVGDLPDLPREASPEDKGMRRFYGEQWRLFETMAIVQGAGLVNDDWRDRLDQEKRRIEADGAGNLKRAAVNGAKALVEVAGGQGRRRRDDPNEMLLGLIERQMGNRAEQHVAWGLIYLAEEMVGRYRRPEANGVLNGLDAPTDNTEYAVRTLYELIAAGELDGNRLKELSGFVKRKASTGATLIDLPRLLRDMEIEVELDEEKLMTANPHDLMSVLRSLGRRNARS